jgi:hypothetical protein
VLRARFDDERINFIIGIVGLIVEVFEERQPKEFQPILIGTTTATVGMHGFPCLIRVLDLVIQPHNHSPLHLSALANSIAFR